MIRQIEQLFIEKRAAVQAFFRRRLRPGAAGDALDLTQEVYSRMLNASRLRPIQDPEAYLFTVARHLLEEHQVAARRQQSFRVDFSDPLVTPALLTESTMEQEIDRDHLLRVLREGLRKLSPPCQAAVVLAYEAGLSYREIAEQLGVSKPMVQKYLAQAIAQCRQRMLRKTQHRNRPEDTTGDPL